MMRRDADLMIVVFFFFFFVLFFLMRRRPPRSTLDRSSAASDVYKRQGLGGVDGEDRRRLRGALPGRVRPGRGSGGPRHRVGRSGGGGRAGRVLPGARTVLSLIHISEPTRPY